MNWLESILYGIVSGLTEFLPVSSVAHQQLLMQMFGVQKPDPVRNLVVHIGILFSLYYGCRALFERMRHERRNHMTRRQDYSPSSRIIMDRRFVSNATLPMLVCFIMLRFVFGSTNLLISAVFLLINGIILFAPSRMLQGNKDGRSMSLFDSLLIGVCASFSAAPGISRVGNVVSASIARGADRQNALNWALLLSVPAVLALIGLDFVNIFSGAGTVPFWSSFFTYILSGLAAFIGGYYGIKLMKFLAINIGFSGFSYYCWGASLFSFLLYLTVA